MRRLILAFLLLSAGRLWAHPEIDEALARLNAEIAASPESAALYFQRGELYYRHADWLMAEANYLRVAELAPRLPGLARARGALALAAGSTADALRFLGEALARDPADPEALVWRSRAHAASGDRGAAASDLGAALSLLDAPRPELFLEHAALLPPAAAISALDEGIRRLGPLPTLLLRAVEWEERLGRIDAAAARLDLLARHSERPETWLKRRGELLSRAGRTSEARASFHAALAAIARLPEWLRTSPDTAALAAELSRLLAAPTVSLVSS